MKKRKLYKLEMCGDTHQQPALTGRSAVIVYRTDHNIGRIGVVYADRTKISRLESSYIIPDYIQKECQYLMRKDEDKTLSLYDEIKATSIETDNHESDLYVKDHPLIRQILERHGKKVDGWNVQRFSSNVDRTSWLDIPFVFQPFWDKKQF